MSFCLVIFGGIFGKWTCHSMTLFTLYRFWSILWSIVPINWTNRPSPMYTPHHHIPTFLFYYQNKYIFRLIVILVVLTKLECW